MEYAGSEEVAGSMSLWHLAMVYACIHMIHGTVITVLWKQCDMRYKKRRRNLEIPRYASNVLQARH